MLPLLIVALCYGLCGWMLGSSPMLFLLRRMMFAAMACTLFALLVNLRWQVSLHMTAAGAATGMVAILLYAGYTNLVWVFCGAVLCSGVLGSARLCLGKHTPAKVDVGFAGGFLLAVGVQLLAKACSAAGGGGGPECGSEGTRRATQILCRPSCPGAFPRFQADTACIPFRWRAQFPCARSTCSMMSRTQPWPPGNSDT